jgi:hypothetical protein
VTFVFFFPFFFFFFGKPQTKEGENMVGSQTETD